MSVDLSGYTREAIFWRGMFIHRYSAIEFAFSELLTRALLLPEYAHLGLLPFAWGEKLALLSRLMESGAVSPYASSLKAHLDDLERFEVHRHVLVHGLMVAKQTDDGAVLQIKNWAHIKRKAGMRSMTVPLSSLRDMAEALEPISLAVTHLVWTVCVSVPLPLVPMSDEVAL